MLRIVQRAIDELDTFKFIPEISCLRGSIGKAIDFRPKSPQIDPTLGFLKVWLKAIQVQKYTKLTIYNDRFSYSYNDQL